MAAFDHDKIQQMRTMEVWSKDQESDHHRQIRIATFILSLSQLANDLHRLRNMYLLRYGERNITQDGSDIAFETRQAMGRMEVMIRAHSIRTFGEDIFLPGNPADIRDIGKPTKSPREFYNDLLDTLGRSLDEPTKSVPEQYQSPTLPPEGPQQPGEKP
jgi:hypothetical protein